MTLSIFMTLMTANASPFLTSPAAEEKIGWSSTILPVIGEPICDGLFGSARSKEDDEIEDESDRESEKFRGEGPSVVCRTPESWSGKAFREMEDNDRVYLEDSDEPTGDSVT